MTTPTSSPARSAAKNPPTATTVADLLDRVHLIARELMTSDHRVSLSQWEAFDQTLYQLLSELVGARSVGPGPVDRQAVPLYDIFKRYPTPLMPARPAATGYSIAEASRLTHTSEQALRARILHGELPATRSDNGLLVPAASLNLRDDIRPADSGGLHPLSRLAVTLGALTDVLHTHQADLDKPVLATESVNRLADEILGVAVQAARHTLAVMDLKDAQRVYAIARFAESAEAQLAALVCGKHLPYAAVPPPATGDQTVGAAGPRGLHWLVTLPGRLDRVLADWTLAAKAEQAQSVPSIEVIRNVTGQGIHTYAAIDALLAVEAGSCTTVNDQGSTARADLRAAAHTLQQAAAAWGHSTTGTRPSQTYVDAAQHLHDALEDVIQETTLNRDPSTAASRHRMLDSLTAECPALTTLVRDHAALAIRLIDAGALLAPAKTLRASADRLHAESVGRYVAIRFSDQPQIISACVAAETASVAAARTLQALQRSEPSQVTRPVTVASPQL
jgi:hypothetical protein